MSAEKLPDAKDVWISHHHGHEPDPSHAVEQTERQTRIADLRERLAKKGLR